MNYKNLYCAKFDIHGIYGDVVVLKQNIEAKNDIELYNKCQELKSIENGSDTIKDSNIQSYFSFYLDVRNYETNKSVGYTDSPIIGLPLGITEEVYYKIALNQNLENLKNKSSISYISLSNESLDKLKNIINPTVETEQV